MSEEEKTKVKIVNVIRIPVLDPFAKEKERFLVVFKYNDTVDSIQVDGETLKDENKLREAIKKAMEEKKSIIGKEIEL